MSSWQDKSDFEINRAVARCLLNDENHWSTWVSDDDLFNVWFVDESKNNKPVTFNPCNNPSDAWSIIVDNSIIIEPRKDKSSLAYVKDDAPHEDKNSLRAAMIVYLDLKGVTPCD